MKRIVALLLCLLAGGASAGVNPDGSFSYEIPIEVPALGPGPRPNLALSYSSLGGNGPLGVGWQLTGLGAISRINYTTPVSYNANDTFLAPSGRLIQMADGSYHPDNEDWTRYVPHPSCGTGPCAWTATDGRGNRMQFGNGTDGQSWDFFNRGVRTWGLNVFTDPHGNNYTVTYRTDGFQLYPNRITMSGYIVDFVWATRTDVISDSSQGSPLTIAWRLAQVVVKQSTTGALVRQYNLEYEYAPDTGNSRVISVTAMGSDGQTYERKQRFVWGWGTGFSTMPVTNSGISLPDGQRLLADVNGDGFSDVVALPKNSLSCSISVTPQTPPQGASTGYGTAVTTHRTCTYNSPYFFPGDFNADGKIDFAMKVSDRNDQLLMWLGNSSYGFTQATWAAGSNVSWATPDETFTGDFNGDGKTDIATKMGTSFRVMLSSGTGFTAQTWPAGSTWGQAGGRFTGDFDGDGKTDIASITGGPGAYRLNVLRSLGTTFNVESWVVPSNAAWNLTRFTRIGDFNGDGKTDFLTRSNETIAQTCLHLSTGRSLETTVLPYSIGQDSLLVQGEFNGDGRTDLMRWAGTSTLGTVYLSTGKGFTQRSDPQAFDYNTTVGYVTMPLTGDLNGDGITDTFVKPENQNPTRRFRSANRDRINHVYTGFNSATPDLAVTYLPAPQMVGAVNPYGSACNSNQNSGAPCGFANASPRPVVSRLVSGDGRGAQYGVGYQFKNGRLLAGFVGEAANLGFESIVATEEATGKVTESYLYQQRPFIGLVRTSRVFIWSGGIDSVPLTIESTENLSWTQYRCSDSGCTVDNTLFHNAPRQIRALGNSFKHYELGTLLSDDRTTVQYDAFGNQTSTSKVTIRNGVVIASDAHSATFINQPAGSLRIVGLPRTRAHLSNVYGFNVTEEEILYDSLPLGSVGTRAAPTRTRLRRGGPSAPWEETVRTFDARGNPLSERSPTGLEVLYEYAADGLALTAITDADGRAEVTVDRRSGEVVKTRRADGLETNIELNVWLRPVTTTWSNGGQVLRKQSVEAPVVGGYKRECSYSGTNFADATCVQRQLDALGRELSTTKLIAGRSQPTVTRQYDAAGRVWKVSQPYFSGSGATPQYTVLAYDVVGRVSTATGPDGAVTTYTYNQGTFAPGATQKQTIIGPRGYATIQHKDMRGNLVRNVEGSTCPTCAVEPGATTTYVYDDDGMLKRVNKPDGTSVTYGYDTRGRRTTVTDPNLGTTSRAYYAVPGSASYGQVATETRPVSRGAVNDVETIGYSYDARGRIVSRAQTAGAWQTTYAYDPSPTGRGALRRIDHLDGKLLVTTSPYRDQLDREVGVHQEVSGSLPDGTVVADSSELSYVLDPLDQVVAIKYPDGQTATRSYDARGMLAKIDLSPVQLSFDNFDARGEWATAKYGNGIEVARAFDARTGRLTGLDAWAGAASLQSQSFAWDLAGNLTKMTNLLESSLTTTYQYDGLDRLTRATRGAQAFNYGFDAGGNLVTKSTFDAAGAVVQRTRSLIAGTNRLADDGAGTTLKYGPSGAIIDRGAISYDYGADSMLTLVRSGGQASEASGFDGRQHRVAHIEHRLNGYSLLTISVGDLYTARYRLENGSVKAAQQNHLVFNGPQHVATLVTGSLDLDTPSAATGPASRYYLGDHLGSTGMVTDDSASVLAKVVYAPYGEIDPSWSSVGTETRLFTGSTLDRNSGLQLMGVRMYDPSLGQFLSGDLMVANPGSFLDFLSYQYVRGNPLKYTDPSGHFAWLPVIIGAAIGLALGGTSFGLITDPGNWWQWDYLVANWNWKRALVGAAVGAAVGAGWGMLGQLPGSVLGVKSTVLVKEMIKGAALEIISSLQRGDDSAGDIAKAFAVGAATSFISKTGFVGGARLALGATSGWRSFLLWTAVRAADSLTYSLIQRAFIDEDYPIEIALPALTISKQSDGTWTHRFQYLTGVRFMTMAALGVNSSSFTDFTVNHTEHTINRIGARTGQRGLTVFAFTMISIWGTGFEYDKLDLKDLARAPSMISSMAAAGTMSLISGGLVYDRYRNSPEWEDGVYDPYNPPGTR